MQQEQGEWVWKRRPERDNMKKTAIVTGGSRGIGFAIARQLGLDGYQIMILATTPLEKNQDNLMLLEEDGTPYHYVQGNIGEQEDRLRLVREAVEAFGGIHVLVNNAGVAPKVRTDLLEMTEESFDRVLSINTKGNMFLTQAVAKQMLTQPVEGKKWGTFPIARWGTPQDVADAVSVLCGDRFLYTTGNYIDVDGGFHIPRL